MRPTVTGKGCDTKGDWALDGGFCYPPAAMKYRTCLASNLSNRSRMLTLLGLGLLLAMSTGCHQFQPSWSNPADWYSGEVPAYKAQYGLTPVQKVDRLRQLASTVGTLSEEEQVKMCGELSETYKSERDPLLRRELVRTIGGMPSQEASQSLHLALQDDNPLVRIAACEAWGRRNVPEAPGLLSAVLADESDADVRLAAAEALARRGGDASAHLVSSLEDRDPAVQLTTMEALRNATGAKLGNDINAWMAYVQRGSVGVPAAAQPAPSRVEPRNPLDFLPNPFRTNSDSAQLASGTEDAVNRIARPIYADVTSGENIQR